MSSNVNSSYMAMSSLIKIEMGVPHIILKVGQLKIISAF
jgi:hypothetical protein